MSKKKKRFREAETEKKKEGKVKERKLAVQMGIIIPT